MKRLAVLLAAFVAVAVAGGFVAYLALDPGATAYRVHDTRVSQSQVDSELRALADNTAFNHLIRQSGAAPISNVTGTIASGYSTGWLSLRIAQEFVDQTVTKRGVHVTAADRRAGQTLAVQLLGSQQVINTLPAGFRATILNRFSRIAALQRSLLANPSARLRDEALRQCPSHRFVAHILLATLSDAQAVKTALAGGGDFAALARQHSTDTASGSRGGELGCLDSQQFVAAFAQAAQTLPFGQVSDPVQTQYGYHVIIVRNQPPASVIASVALSDVLGLGKGAAVSVDPRYGTWDRRNGRVVPPVAVASVGAATPRSTG